MGLNGKGRLVVILLLLYAAASVVSYTTISRHLGIKISKSCNRPVKFTIGIPVLLCLGLTLWAASPTMQSLTSYSTPLRIGPDSIGNAIAASAIADKVSLDEIEREILRETASESLDEVLDFETHKLYEATDFRAQVRAEFLVAGLRWGYPSFVASVVSVVPTLSIWSALSLSSAIGIFQIALGALLLGIRASASRLWTVFFMAACSVSPVILNSWHEGGASQIFALPAVLGVLLALHSGTEDTSVTLAQLAISLIIALISYSDLWVLLVALLTLRALVLLALRVNPKATRLHAVAIVASLVICLHFSIRFLPYLLRRVNDAAIGGWSLPHWISPAEIVGLANAFNQAAPTGLDERSELLSISNLLLNPFVVGLGVGVAFSKRFRPYLATWLSALLLVSGLFLKTRLFDGVSNYQYFKASGCLLPALLLPSIKMKRGLRSQGIFTFSQVVAVSAIGLLLVASINFNQTFRQQSFLIQASETRVVAGIESKKLLETINIIAPLEMKNAALAAGTSFNWIGRGAFGLIEGNASTWRRPLYFWIRIGDCKDWSCLNGVSTTRITQLTDRIRIVRLADDSHDIRHFEVAGGLSTEIYTVIDGLFREIGGLGVYSNFRPALSGT